VVSDARVSDGDLPPRPPGPFGLCSACANQFLVRSGRGSVFSRCDLHKVDDRFPKYPRMPVVTCTGFKRREAVD
jgi:hypothetical protein